MKKIIFSIFIFTMLGSCSGNDPVKDAKEVCDCSKIIDKMEAGDPGLSAQSEKCAKLSVSAIMKYKDDPDKSVEYITALSECSQH